MQSLAVKYRPQKFDEVTGQSSTIKILMRLTESGESPNCFLFCGSSGSGKTTLARIFAKMLNNNVGAPIEIDAASNNSVENVKNIVKSASERSIDGKYKIYIIDEAHMITVQGWNAFLKCIEEPPEFTKFIFCTTDPQKIPSTILNRVMRLNFTRIKPDGIYRRLCYICTQEGFINYQDGCDFISRICNGQMRDGITLLEKCASYSNDLSIENVLNALGNYSYDVFFDVVNNIIDGNTNVVLDIVNDQYQKGADLKLFVDQLLTFCLDICKYSLDHDISITGIPSNYKTKLENSINFENAIKYYYYIIDKLLVLKNSLKTDMNPKNTVEVTFIQMSRLV